MNNVIDARDRFKKIRLEASDNADKETAADILVFACIENTLETLQKAGLPIDGINDDVFICNLQEYHNALRRMIIKRIDIQLDN